MMPAAKKSHPPPRSDGTWCGIGWAPEVREVVVRFTGQGPDVTRSLGPVEDARKVALAILEVCAEHIS